MPNNKENFKDNSAINQRKKLLDFMREHGSITTAQARAELDIMSPAPRIMELKRMGHNIITVWDDWTSEFDIRHRIARYVLLSPMQSDDINSVPPDLQNDLGG